MQRSTLGCAERQKNSLVSLLKETKVSLAPGVAFGNGGEGSLRLCYAADMSILEPAMERLQRFLEAS